MAAVKMYIDKFKGVVLIQEDHPLAVAQRAKDAGATTATMPGLTGTASQPGLQLLGGAEEADAPPASLATESEAIPPVIDASRSDEDLILQFQVEALDRGYSEEASEKIARGRLAHLRAGGDGYSVIEVPPAVEADTQTASAPAADQTPEDPEVALFDLPPEKRVVPKVQAHLQALARKDLQDFAKEHGVAANQSSSDIVEQLTIKLTTPAEPKRESGEGPE